MCRPPVPCRPPTGYTMDGWDTAGWSRDRLIFNMGIPIPGKVGLYIEPGPWCAGHLFHVGLQQAAAWMAGIQLAGLTTVLSLTWESPYLGKLVFILRRVPSVQATCSMSASDRPQNGWLGYSWLRGCCWSSIQGRCQTDKMKGQPSEVHRQAGH